MLSYERLSKKPLLFRSFTGLKVEEFDNIYNKEIEKRYCKHEVQRLTKRKERERAIGAGRRFKLDVKNRFLMLLVYYRLYITYALAGFLFDLDQSSVCRDMQKIEPLVRNCLPIPQKIYNIAKRLKTPQEVEQYFPGFLAFIDCTEQQIPRPVDNKRKKAYYSGKRKRHTVKTQIVVNNRGLIIHKTGHKKGKGMTVAPIRRITLQPQSRLSACLTLDTLGLGKTIQSNCHRYPIKRRKIKGYLQKKRNATKAILERE